MARTVRTVVRPVLTFGKVLAVGEVPDDYYGFSKFQRAAIRAERRAVKRANRRAAIAEAWSDHADHTEDVAAAAATMAAEIDTAWSDRAAAPSEPRPSVRFVTVDGAVLTLTVGTTVVIGWAGYNGDRGAEATHRTETVAAIGSGSVTLTGGAYKGDALTRVLPLHTAKGTPTRQIRGVLA